MSTEWYYGRDGQRGGPVDLAQLQAMAQRGELKPDDLVWRAGMTDWLKAAEVGEVAGAFQQRSQPQPQPTYQQPAQPQPYPQAQPYNPYQQPQPGGPMQYATPQYPPTNGAATTSMVLGIVSLCLCMCFPLGIAAIIVGVQAKKNPVNQGQATAGIVMGIISTVFGGLGWMINILANS
jgi:hypothetical protein